MDGGEGVIYAPRETHGTSAADPALHKYLVVGGGRLVANYRSRAALLW
jgi:hypothetical protein